MLTIYLMQHKHYCAVMKYSVIHHGPPWGSVLVLSAYMLHKHSRSQRLYVKLRENKDGVNPEDLLPKMLRRL